MARAAGAVSFRTFVRYIQILNDLNKVKEKRKKLKSPSIQENGL